MSFFLSSNDGTDPEYGYLHSPEYANEHEARSYIDQLWQVAGEYLDDDIQIAAQNDLMGRFWELYLAAALLDAGVALVPTSQRNLRLGGPDIRVATPHMFIEAIVARPGTGPDKVTEAENLVVRSVPKSEITLRIRAAIDAKHTRYLQYVEDKVLQPNDPYVVAINGARVPSTRGEPEPPWIVGAVFPIGNRVIHINATSLEITGESFAHEPHLVKLSGALVSKGIFLDNSHSGISAVLYCWVDPCNRSDQRGRDFIVVHNPFAANPIPRGSLPCGVEAWLDGENVKLDRKPSAAGA